MVHRAPATVECIQTENRPTKQQLNICQFIHFSALPFTSLHSCLIVASAFPLLPSSVTHLPVSSHSLLHSAPVDSNDIDHQTAVWMRKRKRKKKKQKQ